jgi:hypothetical protein
MTRAAFESAIRFGHFIVSKKARGMTDPRVGSGDWFGLFFIWHAMPGTRNFRSQRPAVWQ